jgi:FKBP-type peptidyl-prolyl cis-trans isomerase (trigger factor)
MSGKDEVQQETDTPRDSRTKYYSESIETQIEGFLLGKVLTIIDASYSDQVQRNAVKSLIKDKFHAQLDYYLNRIGYANSEDLRK